VVSLLILGVRLGRQLMKLLAQGILLGPRGPAIRIGSVPHGSQVADFMIEKSRASGLPTALHMAESQLLRKLGTPLTPPTLQTSLDLGDVVRTMFEEDCALDGHPNETESAI
jgi:hypothetical protein